MSETTWTAAAVAERIGAEVRGDAKLALARCATLADAGGDALTFLANAKYADRVAGSDAAAIVLSPADAGRIDTGGKTLLVADDPYFAFRQAVVLLHGFRGRPAPGTSPLAWVDPTADVGDGCTIGAYAWVGPGARIGAGTVLHPHAVVMAGAAVGRDCQLFPHVTVYDGCVLGDRVTLHAGCSIGQDGFGYATHRAAPTPAPGSASAPGSAPGNSDPAVVDRYGADTVVHHKIPQAGIAVIEDDVEMGAHCSVDRATLGETRVAAGTKLSNGVVIGHGAHVGPHNLCVAQVGLAGSVTTGAYVAIGGQSGVANHTSLGDRARLAAHSGLMHDIPPGEDFGGTPAVPLTDAKRQQLALQRLPDLLGEVKRLRRRVEKLERKAGGGG